MRIVPFIATAVVSGALIIGLNNKWGVIPPLGKFLSPQQGVWQNAEPEDGSNYRLDLKFPELKGRVDVYFDDRLVPHIFAEQENDVYFVQGYIHAKLRLWQMEFQTHAAAGRISEIVGDKALGFDRQQRRLGMVLGAKNSLSAMEADPVTKSECDAYTAGVNAYITHLHESDLPIEYKLLDYKPERWTNLKTALFLKYMSLDLAGHEDDFELTNAKSLFSKEQFDLIYPIGQDSLDPIIPKGTVFAKPGLELKVPASADSLYFNYKKQQPLADIADPYKPDKDNGSNNWAVAGSKTQSGRPILCNDPHLSLNLPSLWIEMQLSTPAFNAYGASFPGSPSIIIGYNDSCAFGFTNAMRDVRDYYDIKFEDSTKRRYWFNGEWKTAEHRIDTFRIRGGAPFYDTVALTVFGPVMYDNRFSNKLKDGKYYAVRWKAHDVSNEMRLFNKLNHSKNYNDYYDAIRPFECPGQNMLFATKSGDIALWQQGKFPAKWRRQGDFVMPGTDSSYMWQGFIPQEENPHMVNPARGFVSSANQLPVDGTYPYYLGGQYPPYRGWIINRKLAGMSGISPQDMMTLQTDNYNVFAEMCRPVMMAGILEPNLSTDEKKYLDLVRNWNLRSDPAEKGATVFRIWFDSLEVAVYGDELGQSKMPLMRPFESTLMEALLRDSAYPFVDNINTPNKETIKEISTSAFRKAAARARQLESEGKLEYGKFKATQVPYLLKPPVIEGFSRTNLNVGGGEHIINATKFNHGPSWRMVVQLTDNTEAYGVYPGGQSGNPGSKYYDNFVDTWAAGKYYSLWMMKATEKGDKRIQYHMSFSN